MLHDIHLVIKRLFKFLGTRLKLTATQLTRINIISLNFVVPTFFSSFFLASLPAKSEATTLLGQSLDIFEWILFVRFADFDDVSIDMEC